MSRTKRRIANLDPAESYKPQLVTTQWLDNDGVVRTTVHDGNFSPTPPSPSGDYMYFEAAEANSPVTLVSTLETAPNLEYSTDGVTWQEWQHTTAEGIHTFDTLTLTAVGDRVYLRGDNPNGLGEMPEGAEEPLFSHFDMTGKIVAGGNIMSLLDTTMALTEVPQYGFVGLFAILGEGFDALLTPPAMDTITSIGDYGCGYMYDDCFSITSAADMSALTSIGMYGCASMYHACSSITSTAAIPSLTSISNHGCLSMYAGCTSLTAAAAMPAVTTIGDNGCDSIYDSCTFNMSSDGTTLNFDFPTPPITTTGENPTTYATAIDVANWMGNTNGFTNP